MSFTPCHATAFGLSLAVILPLFLVTEEALGYVSNYGGDPPPDTTDSIQSRIIPPFSPSLEIARSMGAAAASSPVTPQSETSPLESPRDEEGLGGDLYSGNSYLGNEQQLERPGGMDEGVARGIAIPDAAYPRDLISEKGWPKQAINPLEELGLSNEDDEDEDDEEDDAFDDDDCPPPLEDGYIAWKRNNRVVRATLPHMVPSSCTPPYRCSVSTTVHRRVFLQDGDTLEVILQAPPDYTPPTATHPTTSTSAPSTPSPTPLDTSTGVYPEEEFTDRPSSTPTQHEDQENQDHEQKPSSRQEGITKDPSETGAVRPQQQNQQQMTQKPLDDQHNAPNPAEKDREDGGDLTKPEEPPKPLTTQEAMTKQTTQQQQRRKNPQQEQKIAFVSSPSPGRHPGDELQKGEEGKEMNGEEETREEKETREDGEEKPRTSFPSSSPAPRRVPPPHVNNNNNNNNNKTHLFSRDDHHIVSAHAEHSSPSSSSSSTSSSPASHSKRKRRDAPQDPHRPDFHPRPPAVLDDVGDMAKRKKAQNGDGGKKGEEEGRGKGEGEDFFRPGYNKDAKRPDERTNPVASSPLTIWKASVSEWSSCSTREGGQIGETSPEGIVTITPRFLQVGTNYFIGRSSWSSTECFQLQVTVRSSECGEGSLCSGKGVCYANATMEHFQCKCCKEYMGTHCEEMNACFSNPCLNYGICVDIQEGHDGDTFQCLCRFGYKGRYCEERTNPCDSEPCKNGGTCTNTHMTYTCHCPYGWSGYQCTERVETTALAPRPGDNKSEGAVGCKASPCNNGICVETALQEIRCFCNPGFGGQRCEFEYNECESSPCENGGTCVDHVGKYECLCGRGYTGERCQIKYDLCSPDPCEPNRVCVDKGNSHSCECFNGLAEDDCGPHNQICTPNPCENGGTCWIVPQARVFYCSCRAGFTGVTCQGITLDTHDEAVPETVGAVGTVEPMPLDVHLPLNHMRNIYVAFATLASALLIFALVVGACHCRVNRTYRKCFVKLPRPSKVLPSVRRPRPTSLFDKSRWERSGSLRLETDPDGAAMPMTCPNSDSDAVYYNVDVCDNQELPLIK